MKRSRYTSLVTDFPEPGQHLSFNWLTQSMAVVDEELRGSIDSGVGVDTAQFPPEFVRSLEEMGFIVADEVDERREIEDWYRQIQSHSSTCKIMVLTTYDCNFACTYCVEEGVKRPVGLDGDMPGRIVAWVIGRLEKLRSQRLSLNFYGGEPLLNLDGLERVAAPLLAYTREQGIDFDGSVTTNGALLTRRNVERLRQVGVTRAKVTLDGDREAHNARRPFQGGQGSFDVIVRNLEAVGDQLTLYLGGNVDGQNRDAIPRLLDFLEVRGLIGQFNGISFGGTSPQAREGFRHLRNRDPSMQPAAMTGGMEAVWNCMEGREELLDLHGELIRRGLPARKATGLRLCMLNQEENGIIIDPLGQLYKCPALVGHEVFCIGDLDQEEIDADTLRPYPGELDECMDCRWFPVCGGGCRFVAFLETGDIRRRHCTRAFFEVHGEELIEMEYETSVGEVA